MQKDNIGLWISAFAAFIGLGGFFGKWLGGKLDKNAEEITNRLHIQELQKCVDKLEAKVDNMKRELGNEINEVDISLDKLKDSFQHYKDNNHR